MKRKRGKGKLWKKLYKNIMNKIFFFLQEETKEKKLVTKERDTYNMC